MTTINTDIDDDFDDDEIDDYPDYDDDILDDLEQEPYMTPEEESVLYGSYIQSAIILGANDKSATSYASYRMDGYSKEHALILVGLADPYDPEQDNRCINDD